MKDVAGRLTEAADGGKRRVRADLWPSPDFRDVGLRSDGSELAGLRYQEASEHAGERVERKFVDAVDVLDRRMETDPGVVVLGEDAPPERRHQRRHARPEGQVSGPRAGHPDLRERSPAWAAWPWTAATVRIVEFMYPDFMVAADQVFNQIGKARHMFGGDIDVPFVLRTKVAMGTGYGSQHSMDPAGIFATAPGWRIVAPSTPYDYVGLMNTALASKDPVLVIEHVDLYGSSGEVPAGDLDYAIPFGKAQVRRQGGKVTILTYLSMVSRALKAAEAAGVDAEIIDLRTLDRASLDWDTIGESIKKTNNVLIVEQGARGTSYGAMLADEIQRRWFDWLDQPVKRVTGGEASPSISVLERAAFADTEEVMAGGLADAGRPGRAGMNAPEQARLRMTVPMEVGICCADLDGMLAFYTGVLGLALVNRVSVPADKAAATG